MFIVKFKAKCKGNNYVTIKSITKPETRPEVTFLYFKRLKQQVLSQQNLNLFIAFQG